MVLDEPEKREFYEEEARRVCEEAVLRGEEPPAWATRELQEIRIRGENEKLRREDDDVHQE